MAAKIRPVRVTLGDVVVVRDFLVDFLKLAPLRDFETSSRAVESTIGRHLNRQSTQREAKPSHLTH